MEEGITGRKNGALTVTWISMATRNYPLTKSLQSPLQARFSAGSCTRVGCSLVKKGVALISVGRRPLREASRADRCLGTDFSGDESAASEREKRRRERRSRILENPEAFNTPDEPVTDAAVHLYHRDRWSGSLLQSRAAPIPALVGV